MIIPTQDHADNDYDHLVLVPSWGPDHPKPELSDGLHHQNFSMEIHRVGEKMSFSSDWSSLRNGYHQLQQELFHKLCICKYYLLCLHCKFL